MTFSTGEYLGFHEHQWFAYWYDRSTQMHALIALHSTRLGPAIGGTRLKKYGSIDQAIRDVLRLSEAMTYKTALVGLPLGGGKAVLPFTEDDAPSWHDPALRTKRLQVYGRFVKSLGGQFITAEDVGTTPADMAIIRKTTRYVAGMPLEQKGGGDPARITTIGVLQGMRAAAEEILGVDSLKGVRVAIQGLGNIGMRLATQLIGAGALLVGADSALAAARHAQKVLGITIVDPDAIYEVPCDIFAPCAYGEVLSEETIPRLRCRVVAGCANNPLKEEEHGALLEDRGITYIVDYVINAGGLINVAQELAPEGYNEDLVLQKTTAIYETTKRMLKQAKAAGISPQEAARRMAREILSATPGPATLATKAPATKALTATRTR